MIDGAAGSAATLVAGLLTFAGASGAGSLVIRAARVNATAEFRDAAMPVVGLAALGVLVELLAMTGIASRSVLTVVWVVIAALGLLTAAQWLRRASWRPKLELPAFATALLALAAVAMIVALAAALVPSSKIDETYYHMLAPRRLVEDGALRFYRAPIEAAVLPQMLFQIGMAPLHAVGMPDAPNVVSWALAVTLLVFAWRFTLRERGDARVSAVAVFVLACAPYVTVWQTTGGSHAFGDLALAVAVTLAVRRDGGDDALVSMLAVCAAASKLSLWPVSLAITGFAVWRRRSTGSDTIEPRIQWSLTPLITPLIPWVVVMAPIAIWTWVHSGSPFGPAFTGVFGSTAFAPGEAQSYLTGMRAANSWQRAGLINLFVLYSPLLWVGVIQGLHSPTLDRDARRLLAACTIGQLILVVGWLPQEARFLGGLPFALFLIACASASPLAATRFHSRGWVAGLLALTVPWLGVALYTGGRVIPAAVGAESRSAFMESHVALTKDFRALDTLLPRDARLLVTGAESRIPAVYAPRPVFFDERDLTPGAPVYVMQAGASAAGDEPRTLRMGRLVYDDSTAIVQVYRTLGRPADRAPVRVFETESVSPLTPPGSAAETRPPPDR